MLRTNIMDDLDSDVTKPVNHFNKLTPTIISQMFSFLPTFADLLALARTCKMLYTVFRDHGEYICWNVLDHHPMLDGNDRGFGFANDLREIYRLQGIYATVPDWMVGIGDFEIGMMLPFYPSITLQCD